jgi:hypothetical protein
LLPRQTLIQNTEVGAVEGTQGEADHDLADRFRGGSEI